MAEKMRKGVFDLNDLSEQLRGGATIHELLLRLSLGMFGPTASGKPASSLWTRASIKIAAIDFPAPGGRVE